jgi:hypothetical protein
LLIRKQRLLGGCWLSSNLHHTRQDAEASIGVMLAARRHTVMCTHGVFKVLLRPILVASLGLGLAGSQSACDDESGELVDLSTLPRPDAGVDGGPRDGGGDGRGADGASADAAIGTSRAPDATSPDARGAAAIDAPAADAASSSDGPAAVVDAPEALADAAPDGG